MSDDSENGRQSDIRARIAGFMQTDEQVRRKEVSQEEAQTLKAASNRLDRMLKEFADAEEAQRKEEQGKEVEALRAAAGRLDCLLAGVTGKGSMPELRLRKRDRTR